jgi:DnaJ-class molecular chaperone
MTDFYKTLDVDPKADEATIKSAYRKLAKQYHPDTNKAPEAQSRAQEINVAYETLKDPVKRAQYDAQRAGSSPHGQHFSWGGTPNDFVNIDEILRDIRRTRTTYTEEPRNRDIVLSYTISLEEAFTGKEADITYNLAGKEPQTIQFKIKPGIQDGIKMRFHEKGDDAIAHVKPGDLYVKINVLPHTTFVRMGDNLVTSTTINYMDALLGTDREIPTIDGGKIKMRIPAGIQPGQSLRAAGKGMAILGQRGDMMVEIVFVPVKLSSEQRDLIEKARGLSG